MATNGQRLGRLTVMLLAAATVAAGLRVSAMFIRPELENVPIDRVTQNLERQVAQDPGNVRLRLNLARVHAMAWASKTQTVPVIRDDQRNRIQRGFTAGDPYFGEGGDEAGFQNVRVMTVSGAAILADARRHLD